MDRIVSMMKQADLYKEGDNFKKAFDKFKNMTEAE